MNFGIWGVVSLVVYLAALLGVAEIARRAKRDSSPSDHFLAGRSLGTFVLFLTLYATAYSGNSLLGYPGRAYRDGYSFIMATGFMMSIIVMFHVIVPRLRPLAVHHAFITPGDYLRIRFSGPWARPLRLAVAVLMCLALANFPAASHDILDLARCNSNALESVSPEHTLHAAARFAFIRPSRAAFGAEARSTGTAPRVPKYISSGVCPSNAE